MGADMDKGVFLVKPNIGGLFPLRKPCSHILSKNTKSYKAMALSFMLFAGLTMT